MLLVVLWLLNLYVLFYEWRKKSLGTVLWAMLFVVFTLPHSVHLYIGDYNKNVLDTATVYAIIFIFLYSIIRFIYFYYADSPVIEFNFRDCYETPEKLFNMVFAVYLVCFLFTAITFYGKGFTLLGSSWSDTLYMKQTMLEVITGQIVVAFSGLGFVCLSKNKKLHFVICLGIYIFCLLWSKSRYNLLGFITPFIIFFIFNKDKRKVVLGIASGVFLVLLVFVFQQIRWLQDVTLVSSVGAGEILRRSFEYMKEGGGEFGLLKAFYYFIEKNNNFVNFGEGLGYIRLLLLLIPSAILKSKPRDFAIDMYKEWTHVDNPRGTMHPTLYGDTFANFGFAGCFMGLLYGLFIIFIDENIKRTQDPMIRVMKISMGCTMFVLLGRGAMYNAIFNFIIGWFVLEATYWFFCSRRNSLL